MPLTSAAPAPRFQRPVVLPLFGFVGKLVQYGGCAKSALHLPRAFGAVGRIGPNCVMESEAIEHESMLEYRSTTQA